MVSPIPVLPAHSGAAARVVALARALRKIGHKVYFAYLVQGEAVPLTWDLHATEFGEGRVTLLFPQGRFADVRRHIGLITRKIRRRVLQATRSPQRHYNLLDERLWPGFAEPIRRLQEEQQFDCVMVEYVFISKLFEYLPAGIIKIVDTHDVFADRHTKMVSKDDSYNFYSVSPAEERRGLRRADIVLAIQKQEATHLRDRLGPASKVFAVSHFIEVSETPPLASSTMSGLFLGSMSMGNADSIRYLISDILPLIVSRIPDFMLYVGGTICDLVPAGNNVVPLGRVDDLDALFARTSLLLNPTRIGTGVAIKLLEALGHGVPAVTTVTGARGHDSEMSGLMIVPDGDPSAFADAVVSVIQDPEKQKHLSEEAYISALSWNAKQSASLAAAVPTSKSASATAT